MPVKFVRITALLAEISHALQQLLQIHRFCVKALTPCLHTTVCIDNLIPEISYTVFDISG